MGQSQNELIESKADESELEKVQLPCNGAFALGPPFVQPNAGEWFDNTPALRMPTAMSLSQLEKRPSPSFRRLSSSARMRENEDPKPDPQDPNFRFLQDLQFDLPGGASPNPKTPKILPRGEDPQRRELQELIYLARLRDDPAEVARLPRNSSDPEPDGIQGLRLPLSMFLQVRPQPPGARLNTARDFDAFPAVATGRELARYFEVETPGLPFRQALDYILQETTLSPPYCLSTQPQSRWRLPQASSRLGGSSGTTIARSAASVRSNASVIST